MTRPDADKIKCKKRGELGGQSGEEGAVVAVSLLWLDILGLVKIIRMY